MILVTAAIIRKEQHILIARRAQGRHLEGFWEFPGGKIEPGETPEACLKREVYEELGIQIMVDSFIMENQHDYPDKRISLQAYYCSFLSGTIRLLDHDSRN
ncbi:(deoxy)nucleoside triphosphate pyrophosphohydrolase [Mucilaginibacter flavidus]|uniref:(deoxy)nucleoside triphosphate pyrophosphohydrolase n=1 Tax=Mucilaginibacter flavidus TaxID=2949309 RepID=UPI00351348E5